ncbi:MAG: DUF4190 domain-containing protein [Oscillospiraceae bacterium]|nr:DUF4190 domain-containing protein [Oscillospiraceae bacterium]
MQRSSKGISIAALVCGIVGIISLFTTLPAIAGAASNNDADAAVNSLWVFPLIGVILSILGIVFGAIGMKQAARNGQSKGLAVAGLVCGIVGTVFSGIALMCSLAAISEAKEATNHASRSIRW